MPAQRHSPATILSRLICPLALLFHSCTTAILSPGSNTESATNDNENSKCSEGARRRCSFDQKGEELRFPGGYPQGNCLYGEQVCEGARWGACQGAIGPELEDSCEIAGDDANCDGSKNQGCSCVDGQAPRPCGHSDVGACTLGTQRCVQGRWSKCQGDIAPQAERCDGKEIDEDCDGASDFADEDCRCLEGQQELCKTDKKGDCALGIRNCEQGQWGACQQRFTRQSHESCATPRIDAFGSAVGDEDCNGTVDDNPANGLDPIDCQMFMMDKDQDGWGAMGLNYNAAHASYTFGCFCPGRLPSPQLVLAQADRHNRDCGDCRDGGARVHPGAKPYRIEGSACLQSLAWRGGQYDFDCSGHEEPEFPRLGECSEKDGLCRETPGDWGQRVPACGEQGRIWLGCIENELPCNAVPSLTVRLQACR